MIILPKDWQDHIYIREWMQPVNELVSMAMIVFGVRNTDGYWAYEQIVKSPEMDKKTKKQLKEILREAYDDFIYRLPSVAVQQDHVLRYDKGKETVIPITDSEHWEIIKFGDLKLFKEI